MGLHNVTKEYLISIIQDLVFAYMNKDEIYKHEFEKKALYDAYAISKMSDVSAGKYSDSFWQQVKEESEG